ncbi:TraB/GumN family protein [Caulobacter sp. D4A]|uniref:TraB/GumN family protein n=1 Tax=unclassified Caulobacter TaxID=2648921 RepID=UPI000D72B91C|nr:MULTISPECIES: TraB/GumN family protein [unclassified Caulobacter]PXA80889.1 TraB/GumN family protein [Caulobacter sp. D4A]PXA89082.1 TraB/GumN family protein [Caulobacter sp. D5]
MAAKTARIAAVAALAFAVSVPALAQTPSPTVELQPADPGSAVVEELLVVARPPGPALWLVEKNGAKLYVLGSAAPLPHQLKWDSPRLNRALDQASLVLVPPEASVGPMQITKFVLTGGGGVRQGFGRKLEDRLPPDLKDRFVKARTQARRTAVPYKDWKPAVAGFILLSDFRQAAGLSEAKPVSTIERMAKAKGVKVKAMSQYRLGPVLSSAGKLSDEANLACLRDALNEIDYEAPRWNTLGRDWADGDIAAVRARYSSSAAQRCLLRAPGGAGLLDDQIGQSAKALSEALNRPGVTVAVVDLAFLLPRNGVLDRLKAQGATVTSPN